MSRTLTLWIPEEASPPLYHRLAAMFEVSHPDVNIQIESFPVDLYWNHLSEACRNKQGPDLFFMHNEYAQAFIADGFLLPYQFPEDQQRQLDQLYPASSYHTYYYDFAYLTSLLYTQQDVQLSKGGSWELLIKELSKQNYPDQFGCSINHDTQAAFYNMAELQYPDQCEHFLKAFFESLRVSPLTQDSKLRFHQHEIACVYSWGWFAGWLDDHHMDYQVYPLCKQPHAAYLDRRNTKSSFGIASYCRDIALAHQFLYTFLSDEVMQLEFALTRKVIPLHKALQQHPEIEADRIIQAQKQIISNTYFPDVPMKKDVFLQKQRKIEQLYDQVYKK